MKKCYYKISKAVGLRKTKAFCYLLTPSWWLTCSRVRFIRSYSAINHIHIYSFIQGSRLSGRTTKNVTFLRLPEADIF